MTFKTDPVFSLIIPTLHAPRSLETLLNSLESQTFRDFEVIIVDMSADGLAPSVTARYESVAIRVARSAPRGAAAARNFGAASATGGVLGFPDDDCVYVRDTLAQVLKLANAHQTAKAWCGMSVGEDGRPTQGRWFQTPMRGTPYNCWRIGIEYTMFVKKKAFNDVGGFDQEIGTGAESPWLSGEATDFCLRLMNNGGDIWYDPSIRIIHQENRLMHSKSPSAAQVEKEERYARGFGYVNGKNGLPMWYSVGYAGWSLLRSLVALLNGDLVHARALWEVARGRWWGWREGRTARARIVRALDRIAQ